MSKNTDQNARLGDMKSMVRLVKSAVPVVLENEQSQLKSVDEKRKLLAELCIVIGRQVGCAPEDQRIRSLPRRQRETLELLLAGNSEKQVARKLSLSQHTVHQYVKSLYKQFKVSGRSELMARFVASQRT